MTRIVQLYLALRAESRLQKDWEKNQPRVDRALESPLIARTPREVATAALLSIKLRFEHAASPFLQVDCPQEVITYGESLGRHGTRLLDIVLGRRAADAVAVAAAIHTLKFYTNRAGASELIRLPWSQSALKSIAGASTAELLNPALKPTLG